MSLLETTIASIQPANEPAAAEAATLLDTAFPGLPADALGALLLRYLRATGKSAPEALRRCTILCCADHGVAAEGVSAYPPETTVQMTANYLLSQGAAANAFAAYAAYLVREHCPHSGEAAAWFAFLERALDGGRDCSEEGGDTRLSLRTFVVLESEFLALAGLSPDFAGADFSAATVPFAIDLGHAGTGAKTVQLSSGAARLVAARGRETAVAPETVAVAIRFLGLFLRYHLDLPPDVRRNTLQLLTTIEKDRRRP